MSRGLSGAPRTLVLRTIGDERSASTRYRVLAHRPALEAAGWRTIVRFAPRGRAARIGALAWDLRVARRADLFLVHRRTYPAPLVRALRRATRRLVFDLDDAVDLPPPSVRSTDRLRRRYRARFEATVHACDRVLCGNRELASRLPHDRFDLLPTPVDTGRFSPERIGPPKGKTLGWVGHSDNLAYLESLRDPLRELARRHPGLRLIVVSDRPPRLPGLHVEFRRWSLEREVSCFEGIGVGLMPLDDSAWARSKCAFKALQFLSLGLPVVVSPVGMNREVVVQGETGFLARNDREWVTAIDRLLADVDLARQIGAAGRALVERRYALGATSRRLIEILEALSP